MKDTILESYVKSFSEEFGLENINLDEIFEHFVNYNLISKQYPRNFNFEDASVGSSNDTGIDGCAIIVNGNFVSSPEEVQELVRRNGYLDVVFNFIQSKSSDKFKGDQVGTFLFGIKNLFEEYSSIPENDEIKNIRRIKEALYDLSIEFNKLPEIKLFYVTTGEWKDPESISGRARSELNHIKTKKITSSESIEFIDAERLKDIYRELRRRVVKEIKIEYQTPLPEMSGVIRSFLGALPAKDFVSLLTDADGKLQKSLFYDNVRDFQGSNKVNQEIEKTLKNKKKQVLLALLNNGITIIAKQIEQIGTKLKISDYQIVNGCQTSNLIFNARNDLLPETYVPIKLIETKDQEVINEVIKATNRQTEVKSEAFESLNPYHAELEEYYYALAKNNPHPIFYERRSKQYQWSSDVKSFQVITLATQLKSYVATFLKQPHSTHRYYGELLDSYRERLFITTHDPVGYYLSAMLNQRITRLFELKKIPAGKYKFMKYQIFVIISTFYIKTSSLSGSEFISQCNNLLKRMESLNDVKADFIRAKEIIDKALFDSKMSTENAVRSKEFTNQIISLASVGSLATVQ